tara:strand:+ start:2783 stop:3634 length:852 start_codon:yes stop_codon:yes gene_type:complete
VLYSASNAKLKINGNEIVASQAQLSLSTSLSPNYNLNQRNTSTHTPSKGIDGKLSFSYYYTGDDYFKQFITGQGEVPFTGSMTMSGNFGGLWFESGYLTSYSVGFSPNSPVVANANVSFFSDLEGIYTGNTEEPSIQVAEILNFENATVVDNPVAPEQPIDNFIGGSFNYSCDVKPVYLMGEVVPSRVNYGVKTINTSFEIDGPTGELPVSGSKALVFVRLRNESNVVKDGFICSGVVQQRNVGAAVGGYTKQVINIVQNDAVKDTVIKAIVDSQGCVGIGSS